MGNRKSREFRLQENQQASWDRLRTQSWRPEDPFRAFGSGAPRIQIVCRPSFSKGSFWEVAELQSEWVLYSASVVEPGRDELKVRGYDRVEFASEKLKAYWKRFASLSIPAAPLSAPIGCDGTLTQLALFSGMTHVRYQWWSQGPPGWKTLVQITKEMLADFGSESAADD